MGFFSWLTADNFESIKSMCPNSVYLLTPKEYGGESIFIDYYEGYGEFNGVDIYELVVEWNSKELIENKELLNDYCIQNKLSTNEVTELKEYLQNFKNHNISVFDEDYIPNETIRSIGCKIACYDIDNFSVKYPIKFASEKCKYEEVGPSLSCPCQGYFYNDFIEEKEFSDFNEYGTYYTKLNNLTIKLYNNGFIKELPFGYNDYIEITFEGKKISTNNFYKSLKKIVNIENYSSLSLKDIIGLLKKELKISKNIENKIR